MDSSICNTQTSPNWSSIRAATEILERAVAQIERCSNDTWLQPGKLLPESVRPLTGSAIVSRSRLAKYRAGPVFRAMTDYLEQQGLFSINGNRYSAIKHHAAARILRVACTAFRTVPTAQTCRCMPKSALDQWSPPDAAP